ncbi:MAG TPA: glycosyltransferase family 2 protein [Dehalococcoidia bacterium]|nr:glycosyltransferase family 2 protein [Dehalococcoidia bacterium]
MRMGQPPNVTIVILNWNGLADTRECLHSLQAVRYGAMRVLVVDNGSRRDEASDLESEFGSFIEVMRLPRNVGFAGGANAGMRKALANGTEYVVLLNNDTIVAPTFLEALVDAANERPDLAAACPRTNFYDNPSVIYSTGGEVSIWRAVATQVGRGEADNGKYNAIERRGYADGVCMLIPASALEKVGLLDEQYFAYWEETDWCVRAREHGLYCYYVPLSRIWHKAARSQNPDPGFDYLYRRNALLFVRKRGTPLQFATALLLQAFVYAPAYIVRNPTRIGRIVAAVRALFWHTRNQPKQRPLV